LEERRHPACGSPASCRVLVFPSENREVAAREPPTRCRRSDLIFEIDLGHSLNDPPTKLDDLHMFRMNGVGV